MKCPIVHENQRGFFEQERELKFLWFVSDEYDNLPEQKPDRVCIIASIEEENTLDLKFDNKTFDKAVHFSCFSTETGQETVKKQQGTSTVENTSLKSAKTILSTVVNEYEDYQDHIFSNEEKETIHEKTSPKSEHPAYCTQKTVKRTHAANNPETEGSKKPEVDENVEKNVSSIAQIEASC